jgi:hypothetical protein
MGTCLGKVTELLSQKQNKTKWVFVIELLLNNQEALGLNPSMAKTKMNDDGMNNRASSINVGSVNKAYCEIQVVYCENVSG